MELYKKGLPPGKTLLMLLLVSFACIGAILITTDLSCADTISRWLPIYPNAALISSDYTFVRPRALGRSTMTYYSPDAPETVRQFYRDATLGRLHANDWRGMVTAEWHVDPDPNSTGSLITLYSRCGEF